MPTLFAAIGSVLSKATCTKNHPGLSLPNSGSDMKNKLSVLESVCQYHKSNNKSNASFRCLSSSLLLCRYGNLMFRFHLGVALACKLSRFSLFVSCCFLLLVCPTVVTYHHPCLRYVSHCSPRPRCPMLNHLPLCPTSH
jgi:hypothetical protein